MSREAIDDVLRWGTAQAEEKVDEIYYTVLNILQRAGTEGIPTYKVADQFAEERLDCDG